MHTMKKLNEIQKVFEVEHDSLIQKSNRNIIH